MINQKLAKIFYEIAEILAADKVDFKPVAYRRAALALEDLQGDVAAIYSSGGLKAVEEIPGIGSSIGQKIEEYILKGKIEYYEKLKRQLPINWGEITGIAGVGPKRAKILYQTLGIRNLAELEAMALTHQIARLPGFGKKSEQNIIEGIEFYKNSKGRFLLGEILPQAEKIRKNLENLGILEKIEFAGSLRRKKETIGDVDFLAVVGTDSKEADRVMDYFTRMPEVEKIWGKGKTKSSVRMDSGFNMDLRILPSQSYGAALQYFTGSKEHNIVLRRLAKEKGWKLSEYGLFQGEKMIAGNDEKEIYEKLGLQWIPPEMRENTGEIEAAISGTLPKIIGYHNLKGDLHCHSNLSDGHNTIMEMAQAAIGMGYEYIGISDHTKFLKIAHGLDEERLKERDREIDALNMEFRRGGVNFVILKGCEANILDDGSIDVDDETLRGLDFVIAGIHSNFNFDRKRMTGRMIKAMENPNVDIISHLTGRLLKQREGYVIDSDEVFDFAHKTGTILEINSNPRRLDLDDKNIRRALDYGLKMAINTDAHSIDNLQFAQLGVAQARRGWAQAKDIINTFSLDELRSFLKK